MEEEETTKNLTDSMESRLEYEMSQFEFIIFTPNPSIGSVTFFIDDGQMESSMYIEQFLEKIEKVCGYEERSKIEIACHDYGIHYFYDRHKKLLRELSPKEEERNKRHQLDDYYKGKRQGFIQSVSLDKNFDHTVSAMDKLSRFGMPDFSPKKKNPFTT